jgi:hypothetical protein
MTRGNDAQVDGRVGALAVAHGVDTALATTGLPLLLASRRTPSHATGALSSVGSRVSIAPPASSPHADFFAARSGRETSMVGDIVIIAKTLQAGFQRDGA